MIQLPENFDSIFRYIEVVSQRAEQLINGARVRTDSTSTKATLQARDDVDAGEVDWRVLTQEELDAQRQAMVEQFRTEMSTEEQQAAGEGEVIPDVLAPKTEVPAAVDEDVEHDDELVRLQRLLGMMGSGPQPEKPEQAEAADEEATEAETDDSADGSEVDEED